MSRVYEQKREIVSKQTRRWRRLSFWPFFYKVGPSGRFFFFQNTFWLFSQTLSQIYTLEDFSLWSRHTTAGRQRAPHDFSTHKNSQGISVIWSRFVVHNATFALLLRVMLLDDGGTFCSYSLRGAGPGCHWLLRFRYALHRYVLVQDETPPPNTSCSYLNPCVSLLFC